VTFQIDPHPISTGGREFDRTVSCAWCASDQLAPIVPTGIETDLGHEVGYLAALFGCRTCKGVTALAVGVYSNRADNVVKVIRVEVDAMGADGYPTSFRATHA
jgi:hypothetical protein